MSRARAIVKALGGDWHGSYGLVPGPGHSPRDRSISIKDAPHLPDGVTVNSFTGEDWRAAKDTWRAMGLLPVLGKFARHDKSANLPIYDDAARTVRALDAWRGTVALPGTLGETYLLTRLRPTAWPSWPDCLRFHPRCPRKLEDGRLVYQPALVALLVDVLTNEPRAIARRFLRPDGAKDGKPLSLGPTKGAAVKLMPDQDVTLALGLAEGVETALSVLAMGGPPMWAMGGTAGIAALPILPGVECLSIYADHDERGAGLKAARACAARWATTGRDVHVFTPRQIGADFNDVLGAADARAH